MYSIVLYYSSIPYGIITMITTPIIDLIIGNKKDSESTFDNEIHSINDNNNIFFYWYFVRMASNRKVWKQKKKIKERKRGGEKEDEKEIKKWRVTEIDRQALVVM